MAEGCKLNQKVELDSFKESVLKNRIWVMNYAKENIRG